MRSGNRILQGLFLLLLMSGCGKSADEPFEEAPELTKDPNGIAPLTARWDFRTEEACRARVKVFGSPSVEHRFEGVKKKHRLPVAGLYPDTVNRVMLALENKEGKEIWRDTVEVRTGPLPDFFPRIEVDTVDTTHVSENFIQGDFALGDSGAFHSMPFMMDREGNVRWYLDLHFFGALAVPLRRLENGHFVAASDNKVCELDLLGNKLQQWKLPRFKIHHEIKELPDGDLLMAASMDDKDSSSILIEGEVSASINDRLIRFDREKEAVVREWDMRQVLDVDRKAQAKEANKDWVHVNAIEYMEEDSTLLVSSKKQGVFKITRDNQLRWILAPHKGWGKAGPLGRGPDTRKKLLRAVDSSGAPYPQKVQMGEERAKGFDWPWGQHAPFLMENGDIMLFDNGFLRQYEKWKNGYSRAVQYRVNESKGTVRQIWSFGREKGKPFYSAIISDVDRLEDTGNLLITFGTIDHEDEHFARILEISYPGQRPCFQAKLHFKDLRGSGAFEWGEFDILYRSERMALYP